MRRGEAPRYVRSDPVAPVYDRCCQWIIEAFERAGTSTNASANAVSAAEWLRAVAELTIVLAPTIERLGIASAEDIGCETLVDRVKEDVVRQRSMVVGRAEIGAWTRLA